MKVSVIMPAYNAEKYIKEAIDSILNQTYTDYEFIIINDCSTDNTEAVILSYSDPRIIYVKNGQNLGVAATLNRGLAIAQGEYIARMDADDISMPKRFEKQVAYLKDHVEVAVVGCAVERFSETDSYGVRTFAQSREMMSCDMLFSCGLAHPSVMMRRSVIVQIGGYDREFDGLEDYELWCRVEEYYGILAMSDVLLRYRIHKFQVSKNPSEQYRERMIRLKKRQLEKLEIPIEGAQAESFYAYCLGNKPVTLEQVKNWLGFLNSVAEKIPKMKNYCQQIALNTLSVLPIKSAMTVQKGSRLVSPTGVLFANVKMMLKSWLKR